MGWWVVIHWLYNTLYCTLQCTVYSVHCTALHFALHFALHISLHIALNTALHIALYILEIHFTVHNRGIVRSNCPNAMTVIFGWIHHPTRPFYHTVQCAVNITLVNFTNTIQHHDYLLHWQAKPSNSYMLNSIFNLDSLFFRCPG